jgi:hypothetical protein
MRKLLSILCFGFAFLAMSSFTSMLDPTGCGCGSMASGTQVIYNAEGGCCTGDANGEFTATVLTWKPGEKEGTYEISAVEIVSNSQAQGLCCDDL